MHVLKLSYLYRIMRRSQSSKPWVVRSLEAMTCIALGLRGNLRLKKVYTTFEVGVRLLA